MAKYTRPIDPAVLTPDAIARFAAKVAPNPVEGLMIDGTLDPCIDWRGCTDRDGYGAFKLAGRVIKAHQVGYLLFTDRPCPAGKVLDHLCSRRCCVKHVEPVTQAENVRRGASHIGAIMRQKEATQ